MLRYIIRRLLAMIPLLIVITGFIFIIGQYGAGDLAGYLTAQQSGGRIDPKLYALNRQRLHLDEPVIQRYGEWLGQVLHGDLGVSYVTEGQPSVNYLIGNALSISLELGLAALFIVILVGVPLGVIAALFRNSPLDYLIVGVTTLLSSIPLFVLAPLALYFLVIQVHLFPSVGLGWHGLFDQASLLPVIILAANSGLTTVRFTRASVLDVLSYEYVRAARARGLSEWQVVVHHVLKNSLIPVLSVVGLTTSYLISGSLFLEVVFNLQGFGMLTFNALQGGDLQTMTGIALVTALLLMGTNLLTDVLYGFADPRVQLQA